MRRCSSAGLAFAGHGLAAIQCDRADRDSPHRGGSRRNYCAESQLDDLTIPRPQYWWGGGFDLWNLPVLQGRSSSRRGALLGSATIYYGVVAGDGGTPGSLPIPLLEVVPSNVLVTPISTPVTASSVLVGVAAPGYPGFVTNSSPSIITQSTSPTNSQGLLTACATPLPSLTSVTPSIAAVNGSAVTVTIAGTNFAAGATVLFTLPGGQAAPITPSAIQSTQLTATIPASLLTTAGLAQIAVNQPAGVISNSLPFAIAAIQPLSVQTSAIPAVVTGFQYSASLNATGGIGPYTWSAPSNSLPGGLTLNASTGVISGIPTASGIFSFTATVSDSTTPTANTAQQTLSLLVGQQYVISTVAGGVPPTTPVQATSASLDSVGGVVRDSSGNIYFVSGNAVFKVDAGGHPWGQSHRPDSNKRQSSPRPATR